MDMENETAEKKRAEPPVTVAHPLARNLTVPQPEWRQELSKMMSQWHFSIQQIEQFMITTIESEIAKNNHIPSTPTSETK